VWDVPASLTPLANGKTRELKQRNRFIVSWHGTVEAIAFGHDSRTVYTLAHFDQPLRTAPTASRLQAWDAATGMERGVVGDHGTKFHALAYTADGRLLAATQQHLNVRVPDEYFLQHKMRLWDVAQQKELTPPQMVTENALPMSVDPKSLTLTSATPAVTNDGAVQAQMNGEEVKLTEHATGKVLHLLKGNKGASRLAFSPDGKTLAVGMPDGTIRLWNVAAGRQLLAIQAHTGGVTGLAFHADGRVLASSSDTEIRLWHTSE
jgi:WD40 repeat protein